MNEVQRLIAQHPDSVALSFSMWNFPGPVTEENLTAMLIYYGQPFKQTLVDIIEEERYGNFSGLIQRVRERLINKIAMQQADAGKVMSPQSYADNFGTPSTQVLPTDVAAPALNTMQSAAPTTDTNVIAAANPTPTLSGNGGMLPAPAPSSSTGGGYSYAEDDEYYPSVATQATSSTAPAVPGNEVEGFFKKNMTLIIVIIVLVVLVLLLRRPAAPIILK